MLYLNDTSMRMSIDDVINRNMIAEPADTQREEVVFGSGVSSDDYRGISRDSLTCPNYSHAIHRSLRKGEPIKRT